jgi:beta-galactosidase
MCVEHFIALRSAGVDVDIVPVDADFSGYRAVITPSLYLLTQTDARRLTSYVEKGGCWVATCLTGYVDGHNRCWCGGFPGPELREVFGLWNEEVDYLFDDESVRIRGALRGLGSDMRATDIVEHLHAEGATPMASLDSEFYAGSPVVLRNHWKQGATCYVGARLDEESLLAFYRVLAEDIELPREDLPQGVLRKIRHGSEGPVEFLFNYSKQDHVLDLGREPFLRISDGSQLTGKTRLRAYESLVRGAPVVHPDLFNVSKENSPHHKHHESPITSQS